MSSAEEMTAIEVERMLFGPPLSYTLTRTSPTDDYGRCQFVLEWTEHEGWGIDRPELAPDGKRAGLRRGQVYRTRPEDLIRDLLRRGHTVSEVAQ